MDSEFVSFRVTEFSSQDPNNPADSLSPRKKRPNGWLGSAGATAQEFVVIQLEKPVAVESIKVTNNFSALLEVVGVKFTGKTAENAVGESSSLNWETVVSKSSLMTPVDSRARKNGNSERDLTLRAESSSFLWEKLKFTCQQPFCKEIPYGLRAIKIQGSRSISNGVSKSGSTTGEIVLKKKDKDETIGVGSLFISSSTGKPPVATSGRAPAKKDDSPDASNSPDEILPVDDVKVDRSVSVRSVSPAEDRVATADRPLKLKKKGSAKVKSDEDEEEVKPTVSRNGTNKSKAEPAKKSSQGRNKKKPKDEEESGSDTETKPSTSKTKMKKKSSKRANSESDDEEKPKASTSKGRKPKSKLKKGKDANSDESEDEDGDKPVKGKGRRGKNGNSRPEKHKKQGVKRKKESESEEEDAVPASKKPSTNQAKNGSLKNVMTGCVLAFSGWQNPFRGELRDKTLEMGAKYKADWSSDCTHLVCAYPNTPKFNQVRAAGGRIVKKEWIEECYENKRMLPWRTFMLKPKPDLSSQNDEEDELEDAKYNEESDWEPEPGGASSGEAEDEDDDDSVSEVLSEELESGDSLAEEEDDDEEIAETDDDMEESELPLTPPPAKKAKAKPKKRKGGVRFEETDSEEEEELNLTDSEEADIPDKDFVPRRRPLFRSMNFFLYGEFDDEEKASLTKKIQELAGTVKDSNDESISHCVTTAQWCPEFDEALKENPGLMIVRPDWINECASKMNLLDARKYKPPKTA